MRKGAEGAKHIIYDRDSDICLLRPWSTNVIFECPYVIMSKSQNSFNQWLDLSAKNFFNER